MYIYIYIYTYTYKYTCTETHTYGYSSLNDIMRTGDKEGKVAFLFIHIHSAFERMDTRTHIKQRRTCKVKAYAYAYIFINAHTHTHIHTYTYRCTFIPTSRHVYSYSVWAHVYKCAYGIKAYICAHIKIMAYTYLYIYTSIYIYTHTLFYIYIHTACERRYNFFCSGIYLHCSHMHARTYTDAFKMHIHV